ncbi:MAG: M20 family metallopeptidase [Actinomycetota bacterium]|jgi:hippurate hydrolase|nr:M20 family metallopeptidase [Actinomycetota bacterium]
MIANTGSTSADHELLEEAGTLMADAVSLRRKLHAHPELGLDLPATLRTVLEELDGLDLEIWTGETVSSAVAVFEGDEPGPTTLLRADMDALPMTEDTGLPFSSEVPGAMHSCGHDAHTAMLVAAARLLTNHRGELRGRVAFMFQPGEEGFGGAKAMLDEGLLTRLGEVDRAFAIHVTPLLPSGMVAGRSGAFMASVDTLEAVISGRGGHASMPHDAIDPIPVASEIVLALQAMVTRRISVFDPVVITVGSIRAGTTSNVIPETAVMDITVRSVSPAARELALDGLRRVVEHVSAAHLCSAVVRTSHMGYPVTVNDTGAAEHALSVARRVVGESHVVTMPTPVMAAEDWSFVLEKVPGSMVLLGAAPPGSKHPAPNHSNRMLIDEQAMAAGISLHAAVALSPSGTPA